MFNKKNNNTELCLGFELEGGFNRDLRNIDNKNAENFYKLLAKLKYNYGGDGSIQTNSFGLELKSFVYTIKDKTDLNKVFEDFKLISEFIEDVNKTCGLHIHLSFKNLADYYTLLNFSFADGFIKKYKEKFKTDDELQRVNNSYCRKYLSENDFKINTRKALQCNYKAFRYFAVNYNAYNLYKTIEFRIFPSTKNPNKFKDYVNFLYDYVIKFLKQNSTTEKTDIIKKKRKKDADTEFLKITISELQIEEDGFKNYEDRIKTEQNKLKNDFNTIPGNRRVLTIAGTIAEENENNNDEEITEEDNPYYHNLTRRELNLINDEEG